MDGQGEKFTIQDKFSKDPGCNEEWISGQTMAVFFCCLPGNQDLDEPSIESSRTTRNFKTFQHVSISVVCHGKYCP